MKNVIALAENIKLFVTDVDGILTSGNLTFDEKGHEIKTFHVHDGFGLKLLQQYGIPVAIISNRTAAAVSLRAKELNITHCYQGCGDKRQVLTQLMAEFNITPQQVAYIGDDLLDLAVIKHVGLGISVPNAHPIVRESAHWVTLSHGGQGAVRECCDLILRAKNHFANIVTQYSQW